MSSFQNYRQAVTIDQNHSTQEFFKSKVEGDTL